MALEKGAWRADQGLVVVFVLAEFVRDVMEQYAAFALKMATS